MGCNQIDAAIQSGPISDATRELIETELASQDNTTGFESALKTERVYSIAVIRSGALGPTRTMRGMPRFLVNESSTLDLYDMVIPTAAKPRHQVSAELDALNAESKRTHVYSKGYRRRPCEIAIGCVPGGSLRSMPAIPLPLCPSPAQHSGKFTASPPRDVSL